jgi:tight adherence protein C
MTALILILALIVFAVFVAAMVRLLAYRRLRTVERLADIQDYGFAADRAPAATLPVPGRATGAARIVDQIGEVVGGTFGSISEPSLRAQLMSAGMYSVSPRTIIGYRVILAVISPILILLLLGFSFLSVVLAAFVLLGGWMAPLVYVRRRARLRLEEIDRRLPDMIDLLVVTIEAGLGFAGALRVASEQLVGPLSDELRLTLQEQTMGLAV